MSQTFLRVHHGKIIEADTNNREEFLRTIRLALGKTATGNPIPNPNVTTFSTDKATVASQVAAVLKDMEDRSEELMLQLQESASRSWNVIRVKSESEVVQYVTELTKKTGAKSVIRSSHPLIERLLLEEVLENIDVNVNLMSTSNPRIKPGQTFRDIAIASDLGITSADYAIAKTGSCVLLPRQGLSRIVSLLPPTYVTIVERGKILPSLDELFTIQRHEYLNHRLGTSMNIISGPSSSADIEQTLVNGVHGPGNVHMVLLG